MGAIHRARGMTLTMVIPLAALAVACGGDSKDSTSVSTATSASTPSASEASTTTATSASASSTSEASTTTATSAPVVVVESSVTTVAIDADATLAQPVRAHFDPPFTLQIPSDWTGVLRDRWAFQAYAGNEAFEITFDHTYETKESVDEAIARLKETKGLAPRTVSPVVIGGREGMGFVADSQSAVRFVDSGFHTNQASTLEIIAIPAPDGTTITVFLTAEGDPLHGLDLLGPLARRIFDTVEWN